MTGSSVRARVVVASSLALLLGVAAPVAAQPMTCPEGTRIGSTETPAGRLQWCERPDPRGPIRHGPMLGSYPNGNRRLELHFVDGTPRGPIRAWYDNGQISAIGETRPDNGTLTLRDEQGRRRAQIDVRDRQLTIHVEPEALGPPQTKVILAKARAVIRDVCLPPQPNHATAMLPPYPPWLLSSRPRATRCQRATASTCA